ncbi:hypothetical protein [Dyella sp. C9]|uniref:hypothetical protein n=1 Tax=Dyella sp. C9 TaxID=2202154 RepID=UPI000DEF8044|nr:hypothetical protein [Dyella sp. C9]
MNTKRLSVWPALVAVAFIALAVLAVAATGRYAWHEYACSSDASMVAGGPSKYAVEVRGESCTANGTLNFVHVKLKGAGLLGSDATVFVYEPVDNGDDEDDGNQPPTVRWLSPNHLEIDVDTASRVDTQEFSSHGVTISYRIGHVIPIEHVASADPLRHKQHVASL